MSIAITATGTLLKIESATPGTFTTIPGCSRISGPDSKADLQDVSAHDTSGGFKEYLPGLKDGDNLSAELFWVPSNAVHQDLRDYGYVATKKSYQVVYPDTSDNTVECDGYVVGFPPQADIGMPLKNTLTVKVTGTPTWT